MTGFRSTWRRWSVSPRMIRFTRARITLQWWLAGKPIPAPNVVKQRTVIGYQKRYRLRTFIETGTYTGEMVQALSGHVDRIVTIEVAPSLHARAVIRFAGQPSIRVLLGDSAALLPVVLASLDGPALFWLDGHYMGGESGRGTEDTPVIAEMTTLLEHGVRGHVVLIDDARLFDGTDGYPRLEAFTAWVEEARPGTRVTVDGDIIRCVFDGTQPA
jgi:hypothetical protein